MSEQASSQALESGGLSDLASFLEDTPATESDDQDEEQNLADESTGDDTDSEENDGQDIDPEDPDSEDEPAPVAKITFKVKGEDGTEETIEASTEDLAKSYMRQQDYTKKTQALATRENEAVQFLTQKHEEIRSQYLQQAEVQRAAIVNMAGIKSESEMADLANTDPAAWVAEQQRQRQINSYLNQLDGQIQGEKQRAQSEAEAVNAQKRQQAYQTAWSELQKDGIDKPKLAKIYSDVSKSYGFTNDELANLYDHRLVRVFKDAAELRELKARKPEVTKKAMEAPRRPTRQAPAQNQRDQAMEAKFRNGRAKLNDLAAFLR